MQDVHVSDTWERGSPYERYVGRWSRRLAPAFLGWLAMPPVRLDVVQANAGNDSNDVMIKSLRSIAILLLINDAQ